MLQYKFLSGRVFFFCVAVALYVLATMLSEEQVGLSPKQIFDAGYGSILAAIVVFFALPQLLYKNKITLFVIFCFVGLGVFSVAEEFVFDPLIMQADDPRRAISANGFRWAALNALFAAFSVSAIVAMFDSLDSRRKLSALAELKKDAELAALKSQINPHIMLNSLNNIYSLALEGDSRTADTILMLSNIMQYSLYESDVSAVPLEREIEILKSYIALQEIGIGERTDLRLDILGDPARRRIAPLLLLPLVENAFKHGAGVIQDEPTPIRFRLEVNKDAIRFEATNPFDPRSMGDTHGGGIGLENLTGRLQLLYPHRHTLTVDPGNSIFNVTLTVDGDPS